MATTRLRARLIWNGDDWFGPGEIEWDRSGRIVGLRRARGGARVADVALLPGLVNAHVHLQLPAMTAGERRFLPWVRSVIAARARRSPRQHRQHAVAMLAQLRREGTTAVGEIDSTGQSVAALARVPLAGRCYQELTGYHLDARAAAALLRQRAAPAAGACATGWSPHAPYSASPALIAVAARRGPIAIHTAEVAEEQQFLRTGRGPFAELLAELGRLPPGHRPPGVGAVRHLQRLAVLGPRTQLIHCQELERGDAAAIAAAGASIVVCPGTIRWFGRSAPPVPSWLAAGIPVALGTDSRASNDALSMPAELRTASRLWPGLAPAQLLAMATRHGSRALLQRGLGRLRAGGRADLFAIPAGTDDPAVLQAAFVHGELEVLSTWLAGRRRDPVS